MKRFPILVVILVLLVAGCQSQTPMDRIGVSTATVALSLSAPTETYTSVPAVNATSLNPTAEQTPTSTAKITSTLVPTPTPTPQERLAYLENGQITIRDLSGQLPSIVEGQYRQIAGWSPSQTYLLGIRGDGDSIVIDPSGKILATFDNLSQAVDRLPRAGQQQCLPGSPRWKRYAPFRGKYTRWRDCLEQFRLARDELAGA